MRWFRDTSLIPRLQAVAGLSLIGLIIAGYSLAHHYGDDAGWCNVNDTLNCDRVNRGPYSEIAGVPVALIGVAGYLGIVVVSLIALRNSREREELWKLLRAAIIGAFLFSLYLTYLEAFALGVYCPLCLVSFAVVIGLMVVVCIPSRAAKL